MADMHQEAPAAVEPYYREAEYPADAQMVRDADLHDLFVLFDALSAIADAANAGSGRALPGGVAVDWFEDLSSRASDMRSYVIEEMQRQPMTGKFIEDDRRIGYVVSWDLKDCGCGTLEAVETMIRLRAAHEKAAHARRQSGQPAGI